MVHKTDLAGCFGTDSGFRIDDTAAFADAVSRYIPGFLLGAEGPCQYMAKRMLVRDMGRVEFESFLESPGSKTVDTQKFIAFIAGMAGDDAFFLKSDEYAHQSEYRLLWHTPNPVSGYIDIVCPDARQFCTRFEDLIAEKPSTP